MGREEDERWSPAFMVMVVRVLKFERKCEPYFLLIQSTTVPAQSLDYLIFDYSEDEEGNGTWDAMASVSVARLSALTAEIESVLAWANRAFPGQRAAIEDGGDWDFDLQAQDDSGNSLIADFDARASKAQIAAAPTGNTNVTLTISGSAAFADAFREAFDLDAD